MFDLPETLVAKARKILEASQNVAPEEPNDELHKTKKGEDITINPEIRPEMSSHPYKVETKKTQEKN